MLMRPIFTALLLCLLTGTHLHAQSGDPTFTKKPDKPAAQDKTTTLNLAAKLVSLPVVVRDKKGNLVKNLNKDDFALWIDAKAQPIRYFDKDDDLPYTLGLLVDTSGSVRNSLDEERTASEAFLDGMLGTRPAAPRPTADKPSTEAALATAPDRAFVIQFAHSVELLQDLTDSKPKLKAALRDLDTSSPSFGDNNNGGSGDNGDKSNQGNSRGRNGGGTTLYDAVYLSSHEVLVKEHGRKAIVILSDGEDRGSMKTLANSIEASQRADTIIYAIYFKGQQPGGSNNRGGFPGGGFPGGGRRGGGYPGGGGGGGYPGGGRGGGGGGSSVDGKKVLQRMADETGGRLFEVKGKETFATIYAQIAEELRSQYRLGYSPDAANAEEGYHQIQVSVPKQKDDRIQTRDGYYTGSQ